ncbi:MAG: SulP family inorganic anion transporter [Planctomycetes bacterium]|nr:SulP family inorganic anion transporter [Planctomycetota bacterium]
MTTTLPRRPGPFAGLVGDIPASLVVFLVALPLSLGIAVASGATPQAGLIAATIGGIVVGLLGGAPLQVSGPAAGLTVMVYGYVQQFGLASVGIVGAIAGGVQMLGGTMRLARAALAISPAVLHAMLAGIGILIALGQLHTILGGTPKSNALANLATLPAALAHADPGALLVGGITLAVLLAWPRLGRRLPFLPGSLVAILAGTLVSLLLPGDLARVTIAGSLLDAIRLPAFGDHEFTAYLGAGIALAVVASAESLLCAVATDQLHPGPRADLDRELVAQGIANTLSGLVGGLPITGVIVRSSANIASGARTKWSATLHGVWMAVFVLCFAGLLAHVPMAALGALLVQVGVKLVKIAEARKVASFGDLHVYLVTLLGVVFWNLLWGIGIGFALALLLLLRRTSRVELATTDHANGTLEVRVGGHLSFLAVPALVAQLGELPPRRTVHLHFEVDGLDHAAIEAVRSWRSGYEKAGGKVVKASLDRLWRELSGRGDQTPPAEE